MSTIMPFDFENHNVRVLLDENGNPWFVAHDVCHALSITKPESAYSRLDTDEKGTRTVGTLGGNQKMVVVNEPGLYNLIFTSRKPEAKRFKRWITHDVLPTIRKTGLYATPNVRATLPTPLLDRAQAILLIGEALTKVPGVKRGIAMAATLTCISTNTGLSVESLRHALPANDEPICSLNATQLGKLIQRSARATNKLLATQGLQIRNERDEWELTDLGKQWAEALPFSRNGHSGYQILWNPTTVEILMEVA